MGMVYKIRVWDIVQEDTADFHIIAGNFWEAVEETNIYLNELMGEGKWEILVVKALPQINVVNYENDDEEIEHFVGDCSCPYDTYESSVEDKRITSKCPYCENEIKVADTAWSSIRCLKCWKEIKKEDVYKDENGIWIIKSNIEKEEKK